MVTSWEQTCRNTPVSHNMQRMNSSSVKEGTVYIYIYCAGKFLKYIPVCICLQCPCSVLGSKPSLWGEVAELSLCGIHQSSESLWPQNTHGTSDSSVKQRWRIGGSLPTSGIVASCSSQQKHYQNLGSCEAFFKQTPDSLSILCKASFTTALTSPGSCLIYCSCRFLLSIHKTVFITDTRLQPVSLPQS